MPKCGANFTEKYAKFKLHAAKSKWSEITPKSLLQIRSRGQEKCQRKEERIRKALKALAFQPVILTLHFVSPTYLVTFH